MADQVPFLSQRLGYTQAVSYLLGSCQHFEKKEPIFVRFSFPRLSGARHIRAEASKRNARVISQTYKEIFTALGPVEPFHHRGGLHFLSLHAGDAAELHGVALNDLRLRGHFHTHREADTNWREARGQGRNRRCWGGGHQESGVGEQEGGRRDREGRIMRQT